jgi:hypothetical protein
VFDGGWKPADFENGIEGFRVLKVSGLDIATLPL